MNALVLGLLKKAKSARDVPEAGSGESSRLSNWQSTLALVELGLLCRACDRFLSNESQERNLMWADGKSEIICPKCFHKHKKALVGAYLYDRFHEIKYAEKQMTKRLQDVMGYE